MCVNKPVYKFTRKDSFNKVEYKHIKWYKILNVTRIWFKLPSNNKNLKQAPISLYLISVTQQIKKYMLYFYIMYDF